MATSNNPSLRDELQDCNDRLDHWLKRSLGMSLRTYKIIKAATQLVGAAAGIYAMSKGAPPLAAFGMITTIIAGPETLEYLVENGERRQDQ